MNPSKLKIYMQKATEVAQNSPDAETKVGSLLIHKSLGEPLTFSYNGFARNAPDKVIPNTGDDKHDYMIHAECNLVFNALREKVDVKDCFVVCTLSPCINCCRALWQVGIDTIYFKNIYKDFMKNRAMLDLKLDVNKIGEYYKLRLSPRDEKDTNNENININSTT